MADAGAIQSHPWAFGGPTLALALRQLALFAFGRRRHEQFDRGLFVAGFGLLIHVNFATILDLFSAWAYRTCPLAIADSILAWLRTLAHAFAVARPWFWRTFAPVALALGARGAFAPDQVPVGLLLVAIAAAVIAAGEIGLAGANAGPAPASSGSGMNVFALLVIDSAVRALGLAPEAPWAVFVSVSAGFCAMLTPSLFLAQNHAAPSRRGLALEPEKPTMTAARNAGLEAVGALRTRELLAKKSR